MKGLSGNQLKIIGVILMVIDHLHQMFWLQGVPDWFTWLGRLSAPIFLFLCAEGMVHTSSRKKYLLRLLIGFEFMNVMSRLITYFMPNENVVLMNNIFGTLFVAALYMVFTDMLVKGVKDKKPGKIIFSALLMLLPLVIGLLNLWVIESLLKYEPALPIKFIQAAVFALGLIPNLIFVEGGFAIVFLGVLFYIFREKLVMRIIALAVVAMLSFGTSDTVQWMMVFAAVFFPLYNGERGGGGKYFFYVFYPAHIYVLYIAAWFIYR
jgi:hypothetical protein